MSLGTADSSNEARRIQVLQDTGLLDSETEEAYDRLTRLAAGLLGVPTTLVSLVDRERLFLKSEQGLMEPFKSSRQAPIGLSFCRFVAERNAPLVVRDARIHPEFKDHAAVRDHGVVAYAGMPLVVQNEAIGSFCAVDGVPHEWSEEQLRILSDLAKAVVAEIDLRIALRLLRNRQAFTEALVDSIADGVLAIDKNGVFILANQAARTVFADGEVGKPAPTGSWARLYRSTDREGRQMESSQGPLVRALRGENTDGLTFTVHPESHPPLLIEASGRPVLDAKGEVLAAVGVFRDVTAATRHARLYETLFRDSPLGIVIAALDGRYLECNDCAARMFGWSREEVIGKTSAELRLFPADARARLLGRLQASQHLDNEELVIHTKAGEQRDVLVSMQRVDVEPGFYVSSFLDVTDRKRAEGLAARRRLLLDTAIEHSADGIVLLDANDHRVLVANSALASMFGLAREKIEELDRARFLEHAATLSDDPEALRRIVAEGRGEEDVLLARPRRRILRRSEARLDLPMGGVLYIQWRDVTAERDLLSEREEQLRIDALTGIPNRRAAEAALVVEDARRRRARSALSIAMFDVDRFKRINDESGHAVGDEVLRRVARTLAREARTTDIVARWGGEEFIAVLPGDLAGAVTFAERARAAVEALSDLPCGATTISVGVAEVGHDEQPEGAIVRADQRLYDAKRSGRNRVSY